MASVCRVLCVGDSLTTGFLCGNTGYVPYAGKLQELLGRDHFEVVECGLDGESSAHLATRVCVELITRGEAEAPFFVLMTTGSNDVRDLSVERIVRNIRSAVKVVRESNAVPVVFSIPCAPPHLNESIRIASGDCVFVECTAANGVELSEDNLHPTPKGYERMGVLAHDALMRYADSRSP